MYPGINAEGRQRFEVEFLQVQWIRFEHRLKLIVVLKTIGIVSVTTIRGTPGGLHIGGSPWLGADGPQESGRVEGAGTDGHVHGLEQNAALTGPEALQPLDDFLEGHTDLWQKFRAL
ncbi:ATP synthase F0, C subunit (fragment) [Acidithiobacillus ferrivorans]|uniref:ATP synthase F0, C subunit n=1 Tax=Acidithiobacillus ferrivorans TaxID=160808 RepID=A0A060UNN7_9PROT